MADVLKLVPKEPENGDLATWLRILADQVDSGEMPAKSAAIVFVVEETNGFCCRMRRHGMHYLTVIGAFKTMTRDMLEAV
jgi:hypothetical protein